VTLGGRDIYLGHYNTAASRREYNRLIAEWTVHHGTLPNKQSSDLTISELLASFLRYAKAYHSGAELENFAYAMRPLKALYGPTRVADFGPLALKTVRQKMIEADLARKTINGRVNRIRHIVKWGVENELVPPSVLHGLQAVAGLRFGRTEAREAEPVKPVPDAFVEAVLPYVSPQVAAMIELQRITGMRSGEVTIIRGADINMTGRVWVYTVPTHKTAWRGHERKVYFGPKAQQILKPFLKADLEAYLFSPADSLLRIYGARHAARRTPLSYGNRPGTNRKKSPKKRAGPVYDTHSYRRAVTYGIMAANKARLAAAMEAGIEADKVAFVPHWHPHQLRHNAATNLRREHGIEVARIILGHRSPAITEVYAEVDHTRAIDVMARIG
ncbi:MAG TPA: site-specific integrase, partial [Pirellulales bacterium]|nr:site-specific integrase [Pirellulales bacterium]